MSDILKAVWKLIDAILDFILVLACSVEAVMCFTDHHRPSEYTVLGLLLLLGVTLMGERA